VDPLGLATSGGNHGSKGPVYKTNKEAAAAAENWDSRRSANNLTAKQCSRMASDSLHATPMAITAVRGKWETA
jgi:hypothetical protein